MRQAFVFALHAVFCLGIAGAGEIDDPLVSVESSAPMQQTVTVTLGNPPAGTTIYYTTDGSNPSPASPSITSGDSILISHNCTLKVQAISGAASTSNLVIVEVIPAGMVSAGASHTLALKNDGTVWAWGENSQGQLGDSTSATKTTAVGNQSAVGTDGTVWAWGENTGGRLGLNVANGFATLPLIVSLSTAPDPDLSVFGDGSQTVPSGSFSSALTVTATADGIAVPNALVNFVLTQGSGVLATDTASPVFSEILQVRTDSDGRASVFFQSPGGGLAQILASIGGMETYFSVLTQGTGVPTMPFWAYLSLGVLLVFTAARFLPGQTLQA